MNPTRTKRLGILILLVTLAVFIGATALASLAPQDNQQDSQSQEQDKKEIESSQDYIRSLKAKETELDKREKDILQREQQIIVQERDLAERIRTFDTERAAFEQLKKTWEEEETIKSQASESERIRSIAASFKNIKSATAAAQLTSLFDHNKTTALLILNQLDTRTFGKIFEKIPNPDKAAQIYEALKDWQISVDDAREIVQTEASQ